MIKAMILWLLGATFEVRLVSLKTGKDIPGRCLYKGGYWKARKVFNNKLGFKSKSGFQVRLQAIYLLQHATSPVNIKQYLDYAAKWDADMGSASAKTPRRSNETQAEWVKRVSDILRKETQPIVDAHDIGCSNARQSEFMHEHQDEPNVSGPDADDLEPVPDFKPLYVGDHECNSDGPMDWSEADQEYQPTCSICGTEQ